MNAMLSQPAGMTTQKSGPQRCSRCSGYMVREICSDLERDIGPSTFWVHRCIQCGDIVDEMILRHRSLSNPEALCVAAA